MAPRSKLSGFGVEPFVLLKKLWTPIFVGEGEEIPRWYGCSGWIPFSKQMKQPEPTDGVWQWRRVYYPMPVNLAMAFYYWSRHMLKMGFGLPPRFYRTEHFEIVTKCPHCQKSVYFLP